MLEKMMEKNKERIKYVYLNSKLYDNMDVFFIAVGTPENEDGSTNMKYIEEAINGIIKNIRKNITIVIKSTVPVGTNDKIKKLLKKSTKNFRVDIVSNPEFLSQGTAIKDAINPQRIIIGADSKRVIKMMKKIYKIDDEKYVLTDPNTAELIKYACNSFLALKISYINDIANLCELLKANIDDIEKAMSMDKRIGRYFLKSGIGYGGSCLPKDTKELGILAKAHEYDLKTINSAIQVNNNQKMVLLRKARKYYKSFKNINIAILGLSFKPNTDDLREAPSIANIAELIKEGAKIKVYDPIGESIAKKIMKNKVHFCSSISETLKNSDICFIFTEWDFVKDININYFEKLMKIPIVIDGRNCFNLQEIKKYPIIYESVGRPVINTIK